MVQRTDERKTGITEMSIENVGTAPVSNENKVRSFLLYEALEKPLKDFIEQGDGLYALAVFEERYFPDSDMVDVTLINLIKVIATAFGRSRVPQGLKIMERIERDNMAKKAIRFRSKHPLYTDGSTRYQNVCLVSGMVHLGIPILPYFDGVNILQADEDPDKYLAELRAENQGLF